MGLGRPYFFRGQHIHDLEIFFHPLDIYYDTSFLGNKIVTPHQLVSLRTLADIVWFFLLHVLHIHLDNHVFLMYIFAIKRPGWARWIVPYGNLVNSFWLFSQTHLDGMVPVVPVQTVYLSYGLVDKMFQLCKCVHWIHYWTNNL